MNQHTISRIAIILLAIVMLIFGIEHFVHPYAMLVKVPPFLPGGITWVYIVGAAFILAAISFLSNYLVRVSGYLLALLLLVFVFSIHLPNYMNTADVDYQRMSFIDMLKDTALAAFALYIASNARHQKVLEETTIDKEVEERVAPQM